LWVADRPHGFVGQAVCRLPVDALQRVYRGKVCVDLAYAGRRDHISGVLAGGLNGAFKFDATTVFDDTRTADTLWGRAGTDWFIYGTKDDLMDQTNGETTTKI